MLDVNQTAIRSSKQNSKPHILQSVSFFLLSLHNCEAFANLQILYTLNMLDIVSNVRTFAVF